MTSLAARNPLPRKQAIRLNALLLLAVALDLFLFSDIAAPASVVSVDRTAIRGSW